MLEDTAFSADVAFQKDAAGESTVVGQFVNESGQARGLGRIHGGKIYAYQVRAPSFFLSHSAQIKTKCTCALVFWLQNSIHQHRNQVRLAGGAGPGRLRLKVD